MQTLFGDDCHQGSNKIKKQRKEKLFQMLFFETHSESQFQHNVGQNVKIKQVLQNYQLG